MKNSFLITFIFAVGFIPSALKAQVIFEDNFNGDHLDMTHWNYEEGDGCPNNCGWGNHELEIYNRDYVKVEDGKLVITAVKKDGKYYSGKINSKDKVEFTYGTIEIKAKIPGGKGIWPALWMLGTNINKVGWPGSGEIDLMEYVGRMKDTIHTTLHSPAYYGSHPNTKATYEPGIEKGYHIYKANWTKDYIEFFIDGASVYKFVPESYDDAHYPFRHPFYFLVNMAVGGDFGGHEVDDSIFPAKFYVDYIKVTKN